MSIKSVQSISVPFLTTQVFGPDVSINSERNPMGDSWTPHSLELCNQLFQNADYLKIHEMFNSFHHIC